MGAPLHAGGHAQETRPDESETRPLDRGHDRQLEDVSGKDRNDEQAGEEQDDGYERELGHAVRGVADPSEKRDHTAGAVPASSGRHAPIARAARLSPIKPWAATPEEQIGFEGTRRPVVEDP